MVSIAAAIYIEFCIFFNFMSIGIIGSKYKAMQVSADAI